MATKEELAATVGMLRSGLQTMEARHTSRLQVVDNEVAILQGKIKDKDANGVKKGFGSLPLFDGRVDKYDDLKVITFLDTGRHLSRPGCRSRKTWMRGSSSKRTGTLPG